MKYIQFFLLFFGLNVCIQAQGIYPDPSFGVYGVVQIPWRIWALNPYGNYLQVQEDGSMVFVGSPDSYSFDVLRYRTDGTLDTSFYRRLPFLSTYSAGVGVQSDKKLLVTGLLVTDVAGIAVARLHPDGALDTTFGVGGISFIGVDHAYVTNVLELSNKKIWVFGCESANGDDPPSVITQLNPDGSIDEAFGNKGHLRVNPSPSYDFIPNGVQLPDGRVLFAGMAGWRIMLMQLHPNGTLDTSFGLNGIIIHDLGGHGVLSEAYDLTLLDDGKIVVTGYTHLPFSAVILQCLPDGTLDPAFGSQGVHYVLNEVEGTSLVVRPDGKIISAIMGGGSNPALTLVQVLPDGSRDLSFGVDGKYELPKPMEQALTISLTGNELTVLAQNRGNHILFLQRLLLDLSVGMLHPASPQTQVLLYPNPIADHFSLDFEVQEQVNLDVMLFDMQGNNVFEVVNSQVYLPGKHSLSGVLPESLPQGNYLLTMRSGQKILRSIQITKG